MMELDIDERVGSYAKLDKFVDDVILSDVKLHAQTCEDDEICLSSDDSAVATVQEDSDIEILDSVVRRDDSATWKKRRPCLRPSFLRFDKILSLRGRPSDHDSCESNLHSHLLYQGFASVGFDLWKNAQCCLKADEELDDREEDESVPKKEKNGSSKRISNIDELFNSDSGDESGLGSLDCTSSFAASAQLPPKTGQEKLPLVVLSSSSESDEERQRRKKRRRKADRREEQGRDKQRDEGQREKKKDQGKLEKQRDEEKGEKQRDEEKGEKQRDDELREKQSSKISTIATSKDVSSKPTSGATKHKADDFSVRAQELLKKKFVDAERNRRKEEALGNKGMGPAVYRQIEKGAVLKKKMEANEKERLIGVMNINPLEEVEKCMDKPVPEAPSCAPIWKSAPGGASPCVVHCFSSSSPAHTLPDAAAPRNLLHPVDVHASWRRARPTKRSYADAAVSPPDFQSKVIPCEAVDPSILGDPRIRPREKGVDGWLPASSQQAGASARSFFPSSSLTECCPSSLPPFVPPKDFLPVSSALSSDSTPSTASSRRVTFNSVHLPGISELQEQKADAEESRKRAAPDDADAAAPKKSCLKKVPCFSPKNSEKKAWPSASGESLLSKAGIFGLSTVNSTTNRTVGSAPLSRVAAPSNAKIPNRILPAAQPGHHSPLGASSHFEHSGKRVRLLKLLVTELSGRSSLFPRSGPDYPRDQCRFSVEMQREEQIRCPRNLSCLEMDLLKGNHIPVWCHGFDPSKVKYPFDTAPEKAHFWPIVQMADGSDYKSGSDWESADAVNLLRDNSFYASKLRSLLGASARLPNGRSHSSRYEQAIKERRPPTSHGRFSFRPGFLRQFSSQTVEEAKAMDRFAQTRENEMRKELARQTNGAVQYEEAGEGAIDTILKWRRNWRHKPTLRMMTELHMVDSYSLPREEWGELKRSVPDPWVRVDERYFLGVNERKDYIVSLLNYFNEAYNERRPPDSVYLPRREIFWQLAAFKSAELYMIRKSAWNRMHLSKKFHEFLISRSRKRRENLKKVLIGKEILAECMSDSDLAEAVQRLWPWLLAWLHSFFRRIPSFTRLELNEELNTAFEHELNLPVSRREYYEKVAEFGGGSLSHFQ